MTHTDPPLGLRVAPHLAVVSMGYVMFGYAGVPDFYLNQYDIGYASFGLVLSATLLPFVLVQWPASRLVERTTTTRLLIVATGVQAALALTVDFAPTFPAVLGLRFLWGTAAGLVLSVGATHVARLYSGDSASRQQGVYGGMLTLGGAFGFLITPRLVAATNGIGIHALGTLIAIPAVGILYLNRTDRLTGPSETTSDAADASVLTNPVVILASVCYVAAIGSYLTLSTFITSYFEGLGILGPLNALVLGVATLGRAAGGSAVVGFSVTDPKLIAGASAVAVLGFGTLSAAPTGPLRVGLPLLVMLAVSLPFGAIYNVAADATAAKGSALAMVIAIGNLVALVLPVVTGSIRDATGGYEGAFMLLVGLNTLAIGSAVIITRTHQ
ncbi:MFS transporter [Halorubrum sp. BOL3-1]|uniref:MFS transporter n=1 Tax=Halorubrum sp. BOL3-1 TaxID=2497325 RepID=UPI00100507CC|nr:MFS transporter [Halorubrum sp. BOL3-1]QAU11500.1 MFS transporter [Halorubrum sp. BOL3-1]